MKHNLLRAVMPAPLMLATLLLAACSSAPTRFYTLSAQGAEAGAAAASNQAPLLAVTAVSIPGNLDRPQMVRFAGATRVEILEQSRWSAPLAHDIAAALAEDLSRRVHQGPVAAYPQDASARARYRISVDFSHFDVAVDGAVVLDAIWTIRDSYVAPAAPGAVAAVPLRTTERLVSGRARITEQSSEPGSSASAVDAQSRALAQLADVLCAAFRQFQNTP